MEEILQLVKEAKKYKSFSDEFILSIIAREMPKYKKQKDVVKSVKTELHKLSGMFFDDEKLTKACELVNAENYEEVLNLHTSTAERLGYYSEFYTKVFEKLGKVDSIMDVGCGLNPVSGIYLPFKPRYLAFDINENLAKVNNLFFNKFNTSGKMELRSILGEYPEKVDVIFLFKLMPLVKYQFKQGALNFLNKFNTKYFVITYPLLSVGGKQKGMAENYQKDAEEYLSHFKVLLNEKIGDELVLILEKN